MTSHGYKQNEISQELSMGTEIFKTSYYTVLRAFSFKKIKILITVHATLTYFEDFGFHTLSLSYFSFIDMQMSRIYFTYE